MNDTNVLPHSNDVAEYLFIATSSTEAPPTEATITEASTNATTTTAETTTTAPPLVSAEIVMEFETTTMAPPAMEEVVSTEETTATQVSTAETTTVPPLVAAEDAVNTEETIDWSKFADELEDENRGSGFDEQAAEGDKVVVPVSQSYFSCSSPTVANDGSISFPGTEILIEYDYDLTTVADLDESTLSGLDHAITKNLADIYELTSCKRRHLRGLETDITLLALDSKPADVNVADTSECTTQVVDRTTSCAPISGFMTAYVESNTDAEEAKIKLLSFIEDGMASGKYADDNIIKTSFIGKRPAKGAGQGTISEIQAVPLEKKGLPAVAIGISVFLLVFAAMVLLYEFVAHNPKKGIEEESDEPTQKPVKHDVEKVKSAESTVDLSEKEALGQPDDMYGNIESNTLSSSGEEEELPYAMTEDYSDLAHHIGINPETIQAPAHPESCLAVIDSDSSVWSYETGTPPTTPVLSPKMSNDPDISQDHPEACLAVMGEARVLGVRSFETGTPITTPIASPISSPTKLLPSPMSESSVDEDLFANVDNGLTTLDSIPL